MFEKLDGKKKQTKGSDGPHDEFTNLQITISEEIVRVRNKIEQQRKAEKKREDYILSIKLKKELKTDLAELEDLLEKMRSVLQTIRESPKFTQKTKDDRTTGVKSLRISGI